MHVENILNAGFADLAVNFEIPPSRHTLKSTINVYVFENDYRPQLLSQDYEVSTSRGSNT